MPLKQLHKQLARNLRFDQIFIYTVYLPLLMLMLTGCTTNENVDISFSQGGYPFPDNVDSADTTFPCLPIRNVISEKDSFEIATYRNFILQAFDEPNISVNPAKSPVFRLIYENGYSNYLAVITLTQNEIIFKETKTGNPKPYTLYNNLDSIESYHLQVLQANFGKNTNLTNRRKHVVDSLKAIFPQLNDVDYYKYLWNKALESGEERFTYRTKHFFISGKHYNKLINSINNSGFWQMKPYALIANVCPSDFDAWSLEAATTSAYQIVSIGDNCGGQPAIAAVGEELFKIVDLRKKMLESDMRQIEKGRRH